MIDLTERMRERENDTEIAKAFLNYAEDITKRINTFIVAGFSDDPDIKPLSLILKNTLSTIGQMDYWVIMELCNIYGQNLIEFARLLESIAGEPGPEQQSELQKRLEELSEY